MAPTYAYVHCEDSNNNTINLWLQIEDQLMIHFGDFPVILANWLPRITGYQESSYQ